MATRFMDLPREIRDMVWDEVLSVEENIKLLPIGNMGWNIDTTVFIVNKEFSSEALAYFYKKNAFVCITTRQLTPVLWNRWLLKRFVTQAIPIKVSSPVRNPPAALEIRLDQWQESPTRRKYENEPLVNAFLQGAHLPALVQVLNSTHTYSTRVDFNNMRIARHWWIVRVVLDLKSTSKYYAENWNLAVKLADHLKALRTWVIPGHFSTDIDRYRRQELDI